MANLNIELIESAIKLGYLTANKQTKFEILETCLGSTQNRQDSRF